MLPPLGALEAASRTISRWVSESGRSGVQTTDGALSEHRLADRHVELGRRLDAGHFHVARSRMDGGEANVAQKTLSTTIGRPRTLRAAPILVAPLRWKGRVIGDTPSTDSPIRNRGGEARAQIEAAGRVRAGVPAAPPPSAGFARSRPWTDLEAGAECALISSIRPRQMRSMTPPSPRAGPPPPPGSGSTGGEADADARRWGGHRRKGEVSTARVRACASRWTPPTRSWTRLRGDAAYVGGLAWTGRGRRSDGLQLDSDELEVGLGQRCRARSERALDELTGPALAGTGGRGKRPTRVPAPISPRVSPARALARDRSSFSLCGGAGRPDEDGLTVARFRRGACCRRPCAFPNPLPATPRTRRRRALPDPG